jgi:hypothetical protein
MNMKGPGALGLQRSNPLFESLVGAERRGEPAALHVFLRVF